MTTPMTPRVPSTETRKRKQDEELTFVAVKREKKTGAHTVAMHDDENSDWLDCSSTPLETKVADEYKSDVPAAPATPDALAHHLASLQHLPNSMPAPAVQIDGNLFDRPNPLVAWKPCQRAVHVHQEPYRQRQTTGRFYTQDSSLGKTRPSFFDSNPNVKAQVVLMMETTLGKEYHGDERCEACIDRGIACVRYIEGANRQIRNCGSTCAWCRFHTVKRCSKKTISRKTRVDEHSDEGDEGDEGEQPTLPVAEVQAPSAVNNAADGTATPDDIRPQGEEPSTHDVSETVHQPSLRVSKRASGILSDTPNQSSPQRSRKDHPILRLNTMLDKLNKGGVHEAHQVFTLIRRSLEKGSETKFLIDHVNYLFVPVKQRVAGERDRLSNELAQVEQEIQRLAEKRDRLSNDMAGTEQEMQMFNDVDAAVENMEIDG